MAWLEPVTLSGAHARLEPLSMEHAAALAEAVADGELWNLWYTFVPRPERVEAEIQRRLALQAAGSMLPFTVFDTATDRAAGMTTYLSPNGDLRHYVEAFAGRNYAIVLRNNTARRRSHTRNREKDK